MSGCIPKYTGGCRPSAGTSPRSPTSKSICCPRRISLDAILGLINIEQNDTFKVLTIVSVVGIPPTLIASMYGMNFHNMPELAWRWGYVYGLGLIALSTLAPIAWFKWRGWW